MVHSVFTEDVRSEMSNCLQAVGQRLTAVDSGSGMSVCCTAGLTVCSAVSLALASQLMPAARF